jgi:hypothetical protein
MQPLRHNTNYFRYLYSIIFLALFALQIQAQTSYDEQPNNTVIGATSITYYAVENDTLSRIAIKFTNKLSNWEAIGKFNNIRNDRTIPIGTAIIIPTELLPDAPSNATVVAISGNVIETQKNNSTSTLKIGSVIFEGTQISTSKNGFITLALPDESRISIPSNSLVKMEKLRMSKYTKSPRTEIKLLQGQLESKITPLEKNKGRFEVTTPLAIAGVRGTHFRVGVNDNGTANEVLTGGVAVGKLENPNALTLPAGKGNIVNKTGVGKAIDLLPAPNLSSGFELQERLTLQFTILPQTNAVQYRSQISIDESSQNIIAEGFAKNAQFKFDELADGQYFIKVTAIDQNGLEGFPSIQKFKVKVRPEPPFLFQPKKKIREENVSFNWTASLVAKAYRLQIASDNLFQKIVLDQSNINSVEFNISNLELGTYFWRVATITDTKGTPDQGPFSFPESFQLLAPQKMNAASDTGKDELEFSWLSEAGQEFLVQISNDKDFNTMYFKEETKNPKLAIKRPLAGTYYIRVRATDDDGFVGRFSATQKFEIFQRWTTSNGEALQSLGGAVRPTQ